MSISIDPQTVVVKKSFPANDKSRASGSFLFKIRRYEDSYGADLSSFFWLVERDIAVK